MSWLLPALGPPRRMAVPAPCRGIRRPWPFFLVGALFGGHLPPDLGDFCLQVGLQVVGPLVFGDFLEHDLEALSSSSSVVARRYSSSAFRYWAVRLAGIATSVPSPSGRGARGEGALETTHCGIGNAKFIQETSRWPAAPQVKKHAGPPPSGGRGGPRHPCLLGCGRLDDQSALRPLLGRLVLLRLRLANFHHDPATRRRKGPHKLVQRYVRGGTLDLGDPTFTTETRRTRRRSPFRTMGCRDTVHASASAAEQRATQSPDSKETVSS